MSSYHRQREISYKSVSHIPVHMSKAGSKGMASMAVTIPIFMKSDILLDLAVTLPRGLLYECTQQSHRVTLTC